jgi:hypothetical protein
MPDKSGVGATPPWRGTCGTKRSGPAKELLWLILYGDERPTCPGKDRAETLVTPVMFQATIVIEGRG